jgi:hypothetical protein
MKKTIIRNAMEEELYVEDIIVPIYITPKKDETKFAFLGTGFYIDKNGHLLTCRHVADNLDNSHRLFAYQIGKRKDLELTVLRKSTQYDLALCKSSPPKIKERLWPWPIINEPFITIGDEIEVYGYWYEPLGPDEVPFRQRYMKGHITGVPIDPNYPDSFELSFPVLSGMSGSPLIHRAQVEDESEKRVSIVGCAYGCRETEIVRHKVTIEENAKERIEERVSRIVELGLAYKPKAIFSLFHGFDICMEVFGDVNI